MQSVPVESDVAVVKMAAARIATVLSCSSDHVSAIETGAPLAAHRHTIDAALLSQLMSPASIGNDALAFLIKTYQRAHQNGENKMPVSLIRQQISLIWPSC